MMVTRSGSQDDPIPRPYTGDSALTIGKCRFSATHAAGLLPIRAMGHCVRARI